MTHCPGYSLVHFAVEQVVLFLARRADATGGAAYKENRADRDNDLRQVRTEMRNVQDDIMEM
jgi:hypothetical protein